jgi:integrase
MALANRFLAVKKTLENDGELSPRTFYGYYHCCEMLLRVLGKQRVVNDLRTEDFETIRAATFKGLGMEARKTVVRNVRALFNFAYKEGLIDRPVRFGEAFKAPSAKNQQKDRVAKKDARLLTADQIRALIGVANVHIRAMILLGVNCGFGNNDCATLTFSALEMEAGWHNHPRPKTGVPRRGKLWPETIDALRAAIAKRRKPKDAANADLIFITKAGEPFVRWKKKAVPDPSKSAWRDAVALASRILFLKLGINHGASFYSLRRMTETIGGGCKDQVAVDAVMGHARGDMASVYRLEIEDSRLEAVAEHIHKWLFPPAPSNAVDS